MGFVKGSWGCSFGEYFEWQQLVVEQKNIMVVLGDEWSTEDGYVTDIDCF